MDHDALREEANDLLAIRRGRLGGAPKCWNIGRDRQDATMFLRCEMRRVLVQESVVFFPQIALCTQRILPIAAPGLNAATNRFSGSTA